MVVVFNILFENTAYVALIQDQDMIQALLTDRAHSPFSESIRPGSSKRRMNSLDPFRMKNGIEG